MSGVIAIVGFTITKLISKSLVRQNSKLSKDGKRDLLMLWIMIISLTFVSTIQIASDVTYYFIVKDDWYKFTESSAINAIILWSFRMISVNTINKINWTSRLLIYCR